MIENSKLSRHWAISLGNTLINIIRISVVSGQNVFKAEPNMCLYLRNDTRYIQARSYKKKLIEYNIYGTVS